MPALYTTYDAVLKTQQRAVPLFLCSALSIIHVFCHHELPPALIDCQASVS